MSITSLIRIIVIKQIFTIKKKVNSLDMIGKPFKKILHVNKISHINKTKKFMLKRKKDQYVQHDAEFMCIKKKSKKKV